MGRRIALIHHFLHGKQLTPRPSPPGECPSELEPRAANRGRPGGQARLSRLLLRVGSVCWRGQRSNLYRSHCPRERLVAHSLSALRTHAQGAFLCLNCSLGSLWNKHWKIFMVVNIYFQPGPIRRHQCRGVTIALPALVNFIAYDVSRSTCSCVCELVRLHGHHV